MNKSQNTLLLAICIVIATPPFSVAQWLPGEDNTDIGGYVKELPILTFLWDQREVTVSNLIHARLNFRWFPFAPIALETAGRMQLLTGDQVEVFGLQSPFIELIGGDRGYADLTKAWPAVLFGNVDRALVSFNAQNLHITVGRQRINWGTNFVWNPSDWFNAFEYLDFDYEERPGSDALRVQYYPGALSVVEAAFRAGRDRQDRTYALMYRLNRLGYDFQFQGGIFGLDATAAFSWAGSILGGGFRGEVSTYLPVLDRDEGFSVDDNITAVASLSGDYTFANGLYILSEVLYNGFGDNGVFDTLPLLSAEIDAKNLSPARFQIYGSVAYPVTPLIRGSVSAMVNPGDGSVFTMPSVDWSLTTNIDLLLISQLYFGGDETIFGSLPNLLALRLRWSF